jgi:superfamily II DNA or RNA helicase
MGDRALLKKYKILLSEIDRLKHENSRLKAQLALVKPSRPPNATTSNQSENNNFGSQTNRETGGFNVSNRSDARIKINLFMSLFKGRKDVYAQRWENILKNRSGYAPVCLNQWKTDLCGKPKIPCVKCGYKSYAALYEKVIERHLRGNCVAGVYPMLSDETCWFLAMDFDGMGWRKDITTLRKVCNKFDIPVAVERSRSGNGGHLWFFFEGRLAVSLARKFGTALLTYAMDLRYELQFKSYDRLFPSQDTLPTGGLGNLIALPLQKTARQRANSEFIDENFKSYHDQWAFLAAIKRISEPRLMELIAKFCHGDELGRLRIDVEEEKSWKFRKIKRNLQKNDFPQNLSIIKANMLFLPKKGISSRGLNGLKRLASFKNPMFYKQQAMRLPTYGHPRVISCADETKDYLCLPRGCQSELTAKLENIGINIDLIPKYYRGKGIDVIFKGKLRDEQALALSCLLPYDIGILSGTTAFGKTVVAIKLIAEKKVNTLILVDKVNLLSQWKAKLLEFLTINEELPRESNSDISKRGPKKKINIIGQLGGGKNTLNGIVDIALMQSLSRKGEVKDCVKNYGMIIADECHHASAFTYEQILKKASAQYIYGLTATPERKDGHHPILLMHCGPIRYRDNPKKQAEKRPFDHHIIPRFTTLKTPLKRDEKDITIHKLYAEIVEDEFRNQQIIDDVLENYKAGRNCLVLSLRTAHVEILKKRLKNYASYVIALVGGMGKKQTKAAFEQLSDIPAGKKFIIVATGHFIGEGFDEPRLDTLFLTMPISWKGTLQQYAGRLHRLLDTKKEVRIYDYVDIKVKMLEKMYQKRLNGYASMGYKAKGEGHVATFPDIIFNKDNFLPVFNQDLAVAKREVLIVSPFVRKRRTDQMIQYLKIPIAKQLRITVVTRPKEDFKPKDHDALQRSLDFLAENGISLIFKSNFHQKFAVMDKKIVWYGSINLLSYGSAQESIMRLESANIAHELIKSIEDE